MSQSFVGAVVTPKVADSGALAKSLEHALSYICAKFCTFRLISTRKKNLRPPTNMNTHPYVYCFLRPFLAHGMFFVQNKCLQWIQHHDKPLVRPLRSSLNTQKKNLFLGIFLLGGFLVFQALRG